MKKMRLGTPSKNGFIYRYIFLVGGSNIIKECENQSNGRYLKKWPLTTVLSYMKKSTPGKTFHDIAFLSKMTQFSDITFSRLFVSFDRTLYEILH